LRRAAADALRLDAFFLRITRRVGDGFAAVTVNSLSSDSEPES
jgi:hypothetical protein